MKITGYLQTVRPIHIASSTEGNATGIATETVPDYESNRTTRVPFVPATVLRGLLRRTASDYSSEQMLRHGVRIPAEIFNALRHGSNSGRMTNDNLNPAFFDAQRGHPIMGLFGGGPRQGSAGALITDPMYPLCEELTKLGMVSEDPMIPNPPKAFLLMQEATMYPSIDMATESDPLFDVIENREEAIDKFIAADVARRTKEGGTGAGASTLRSSNLLVYRYMIPGTLLSLKLKIRDNSPDHMAGFLIKILTEALNRNQIGGMQRIGIGADVFSLASAANRLKLDGEDLFDYDGEKLSVTAGTRAAELVTAFDAWEDDGRAWTLESLWDATGFTGIDLNQEAVKKETRKAKSTKTAKGEKSE